MMNDGLVRIAAISPQIKVANPVWNAASCKHEIETAVAKGAHIVVLPECTMTSYVSNDLLYQDTLLQSAEDSLHKLICDTASLNVLFTVGIPLRVNGKLYNSVAVGYAGRLLGVVPKTHIPTYGVDFEGRWFEPGPARVSLISIAGFDAVPFGSHQVFRNTLEPEMCIGIEICEDIWSPDPPSIGLALAGATIICNSSASNAGIGKARYRRGLISGQSARLLGAYIYCSSREGDSSDDVVVGGHDLITENGVILSEAKPFEGGHAIADIDVEALCEARRGMSSFVVSASPELMGYTTTSFEMVLQEQPLQRPINPLPFVPTSKQDADEECALVAKMMTNGLLTRMKDTAVDHLFIEAEQDIDFLIAVLIAMKAIGEAHLPATSLTIVEPSHGHPGFGKSVSEALACTYETETTKLFNGSWDATQLVVDCHDMTRIGLGTVVFQTNIATTYALNGCLGRTYIPMLLTYLLREVDTSLLDNVANVVINSVSVVPVSEDDLYSLDVDGTLPPADVCDFYLSSLLDSKYSPAKTLRFAVAAYKDAYDKHRLAVWLQVFYERFFATQFMRTCLPASPRLGGAVDLAHDGFMMASHPDSALWVDEAKRLVLESKYEVNQSVESENS